jgi:G:T-mismatch repair DNA endonuclease (very short patch repair protein)
MVILEEETYIEYGYFPCTLKSKSNKKILVVCDNCGSLREIEKSHYHPLCKSCTMKGRRNPAWNGGLTKRTCLMCGKIFYKKPSELKKGYGKYCSLECMGKAMRGEKHPRWKGGRVKQICKYCGNTFHARKCDIIRGQDKYCSVKCFQEFRRTSIDAICQTCGNAFTVIPAKIKRGHGKYCSRSCTVKAQRHNAKPHKTQPELIFEDLCTKTNLPFHFVGDGSLWICNANPDFIHNTRKLCVEIFGDYWHSPLLNGYIRYTATLEGRRKQLKAEGYKLIVFWESDLKREDVEEFVLYTLKKYNIFPSTT